MRADDDLGRGTVAAGQGHIQIGGGVAGDFQPEATRDLGDAGVCPLLPGAIGIARHAGLVQTVLAQPVEQPADPIVLRRDRGLDLFAGTRDHGVTYPLTLWSHRCQLGTGCEGRRYPP